MSALSSSSLSSSGSSVFSTFALLTTIVLSSATTLVVFVFRLIFVCLFFVCLCLGQLTDLDGRACTETPGTEL